MLIELNVESIIQNSIENSEFLFNSFSPNIPIHSGNWFFACQNYAESLSSFMYSIVHWSSFIDSIYKLIRTYQCWATTEIETCESHLIYFEAIEYVISLFTKYYFHQLLNTLIVAYNNGTFTCLIENCLTKTHTVIAWTCNMINMESISSKTSL